jgi:hypothetical protein
MDNNNIFCDYFPQLPARWHCPKCLRNFSASCIKNKDYQWANQKEQRCPICLDAVESLGIANSITPFWQQLPKFFNYPNKDDAFVYLLTLSLINILPSFTVGSLRILLMVIITAITYYILLMYAFKCLNHTATGHLKLPNVSVEYSVLKPILIFKQIQVYGLFYLLVILAQMVGNITTIITVLFTLIAIPASTMLLSIHGLYFSAINPINVLSLIKIIGKPYFIFYSILLLVYATQEGLKILSSIYVFDFILLPILFFIQGYFIIAIFAMMGYVLYQYHEPLGLKGIKEFEEIDLQSIRGISEDFFTNEINILIKENLQEIAIKRLKKKVYDSQNIEYYKKLLPLLKGPDNKADLLKYGMEAIELIQRKPKHSDVKSLQDILAIYKECLIIDNSFYYPNEVLLFNLGKLAYSNSNYELSFKILSQFQQKFPESNSIVESHFLLAKILIDFKQNDMQAKKILESLIKKYPESSFIPEINQYLQFVVRLTQN